MAYVYLIQAHNSGGLHKIGKTLNIDRRMRQLKVSQEDRVKVIELPSMEVMDAAERALHRAFAGVRIPQSEMFNLSPEQVAQCGQVMDSLGEDQVEARRRRAQRLAEAKAEEKRCREELRVITIQLNRAKAAEKAEQKRKEQEEFTRKFERQFPRALMWVTGFCVFLCIVSGSLAPIALLLGLGPLTAVILAAVSS